MFNTVEKRSILTQLFLCVVSLSFGQTLWPGDINNNGIVNGVDAIYWAAANGEEDGPPREDGNTEWKETIYIPWARFFGDSIDLAFADCNGDGEVDEEDLEDVLLENFGETHGELIEDALSREDAERGIPLRIVARKDKIRPKEELTLAIQLGSNARPAENFIGLTFDLVFNPDLVNGENNAVTVETREEWASNNESQFISYVRRKEDQPGVASIGLLYDREASISGVGEIGEVSIVIEDIAVGIYEEIEFKIENILIGTDQLDVIPVEESPSPVRVPFDDSVTPTKDLDQLRHKIRIYPNPAHQHIMVELPTEGQWKTLEILDLKGRRVGNVTVKAQQLVQLPLTDLPTGSYYLRVISDTETQIHRFLLSR